MAPEYRATAGKGKGLGGDLPWVSCRNDAGRACDPTTYRNTSKLPPLSVTTAARAGSTLLAVLRT